MYVAHIIHAQSEFLALINQARPKWLVVHLYITHHLHTYGVNVCLHTYYPLTIRYYSCTSRISTRTLVMHMNICSNIKCRAHTRGDHMVESYSCTMKNHNFRKCIYACFLCFRTAHSCTTLGHSSFFSSHRRDHNFKYCKYAFIPCFRIHALLHHTWVRLPRHIYSFNARDCTLAWFRTSRISCLMCTIRKTLTPMVNMIALHS